MEDSSSAIPERFDIDIVRREDLKTKLGMTGKDSRPETVVRILASDNGRTWGYVAVDNTVRGPSLGGVRMVPDATLEEVCILARAMTFKNAAASLPLGGGKSILSGDPGFYAAHPALKKELMRAFAEALWPVSDYIPGPDMGTDEQDMQTLYDAFTELNGGPHHGRGGIGRPAEKGGLPIDDWGLTAHGLFCAAIAAEEYEREFRVEGSRVIVQGFGNVGSHAASKLHAAGAKIVGASDIHAALYHSDGLNMDELLAIRKEPTGLAGYSGPTESRFGPQELDNLLNIPCDVIVPAARPGVIGSHNADLIRTKIILQGANSPVDETAEVHLEKEKGIACLTDFIVNAGGVIACSAELAMDTDGEFRQRIRAQADSGRAYLETLIRDTVTANVREIYDRLGAAKDRARTWRDAALALARERLKAPADAE